MRKILTLTTFLTFLLIWLINPVFAQADPYSLPLFTVTNILVVPKDQQLDPQYPQLIANAVQQVQGKFAQLLEGQTFKINETNNPLVIRSNKTLSELCNQKGPCYPSTLLVQLSDTGLPISGIGKAGGDKSVILNIYVVGWTHPAIVGVGDWNRQYESGWTVMGDYALASLKSRFNRNQEMLCQQILGRSCSSEDAVRLTAHELGHAFGLLLASRWANGHPCTTAKVDECRFDLDPKYRPDPIEWTHSLMGYGSIPYNNLGLNDSCVNPEKTLLKNSRYFGRPGFDRLNFENCLKLPTTGTIKITNVENSKKIATDDEIIIQTEGLLPTDSNLKVIFPPDNPSQSVEILEEGKLRVIVPRTSSGEVILVLHRGPQELRSNPYPITIISRSPLIQKIEPAEAKPGDTITIWGDYFMDDRPNIQSSKPVVRLGYNTEISDILEQAKNYIKFQIPLNATAREVPVTVEVGTVNTKTNKSFSQGSNWINIKVLANSRLEGRLERATTASTVFKDVSPGEAVSFTAFILENSSIPQTAEIWVANQSGETGCDGKLQGKWCQAGQLSLPASSTPGRYYTFTGSYIPKSSGTYIAVVNILGSSGVKCSGDPNRPVDWVDCGENSRLYFAVLPKQESREATESAKITIQPIASPSATISTEPTCSLTANQTTIKTGEWVTWTITSNPKGSRAYWRGTNNGVSIVPTEVEGYSAKTPWEEFYKYPEAGFYTRYVGIEDETSTTICTTNEMSVSVQEANKKITNVTLSSVGQVQDMLNAGPIRIHLPGKEGYAQTFTVLVTVQYSDSSRSYQNLSFRYNPSQTTNPPNRTVCPGECGDANGKTAGGLICSGWIKGNKWSNCPDPQYPYCFTCPEVQSTIPTPLPSPVITPSQPPSATPAPTTTPIQSTSSTNQGLQPQCIGSCDTYGNNCTYYDTSNPNNWVPVKDAYCPGCGSC